MTVIKPQNTGSKGNILFLGGKELFQHNQNIPVENTDLVDTTLSSKKVQLENPELSS